MNLSKLFQNSIKLQRCTGLNPQQFGALSLKIKPLWETRERQRLSRPDRQRKMGAGHPYRLKTMEEKLLVILLWYKLYPAFWFLGLVVGLDAANVCKLVQKLRPLLQEAADPELSIYFKKINQDLKPLFKGRKKISSFKDLKEQFPEIAEILIDATEQERERPRKRIQKAYRSGKRKQHTLKTQIAVNRRGRILNISKTYPGSVHDLTVLRTEKTTDKIPETARVYLDRGYQGIQREGPRLDFRIPPKRNRWKRLLSRSEKILKTRISKKRILIEHVFSRLKKYRLLADKIRHEAKNYNQDFRNIASLVNFRLSYQI